MSIAAAFVFLFSSAFVRASERACPLQFASNLTTAGACASPPQWTPALPSAPYNLQNCAVAAAELVGYYPEGEVTAAASGFSWFVQLPRPLLEASMSYEVFFSPGFEWKAGGVLPGLCGLDCPTGCMPVARGRGWSVRPSWRPDGGVVSSAYYPGKPAAFACGEDWWWDDAVADGRWFTVRLYVQVNTPGVPDGVTRGWIDGRLVHERSGVLFRHMPGDGYAVTRAHVETYAGGSDAALYAPGAPQYAKFRNFAVWEGDCDLPGGVSAPPEVVEARMGALQCATLSVPSCPGGAQLSATTDDVATYIWQFWGMRHDDATGGFSIDAGSGAGYCFRGDGALTWTAVCVAAV